MHKRQLRFACYSIFLIMDSAVLFASSLLIARWLRDPSSLFGRIDADGVLLVLFAMFAGLGFRPRMLHRWQDSARHAVQSAAGASISIVVLGLALHAPLQVAPIDILATLAIASAAIVIGHRAVGRWATKMLRSQPLSIALIKDGTTVHHTCLDLRIECGTRFHQASDASYPLLLDRLARALTGSDIVYVACPPDRRRYWAMALRGIDIPAKFLMPELERGGVHVTGDLADMAQVMIETDAMGTRDRVVKRLFDLAIAIPLLIFFAPLLGLVAILIKLDSPGPVFFVQQRVGRGNLLFAMMKFRSMYQASCDGDGLVSTRRGDSRITSVGRFLRRTSIDELPQLLNVVRGDMSFVGPRPHALGSLAGDELFWEVDARYCDRHVYKPGLTGLAQVRGLRGATDRREDLIERLQADLEYIDGWNVWRDLLILFATVKVVFHKNAY